MISLVDMNENLSGKVNVSLIVPVFDEEKSIQKFLSDIINFDYFDEIICVNDGSGDRSLEVLKSFDDNINLINLEINQGKGKALAEGVRTAKNDTILFLDADLYDLNLPDIQIMVDPVLKEGYDYIIGYWHELSMLIFKKLSGQRVYHRSDLMPLISKMERSRYGVEVLLNDAFKDKKGKYVYFNKVKHLEKFDKFSMIDSYSRFIQEGVEIALELGKKEVFSIEDIRLLNKIREVRSVKEVITLVKSIKNRRIRELLEDYFKKYLYYVIPRK